MSSLEYDKYLYLRKVDEVHQKIATGDYYHIITASGLIRHLLLEGKPLAHRANRDTRLKLKFEVAKRRPGPPPIARADLLFHAAPIEPLPKWKTEIVNESELMAMYCATVRGHEYKVKDVLELCAYVLGGVHLETPTEKEDALVSLNTFCNIGGQQAVMKILVEIVTVILKGLEPLTFAAQGYFRTFTAGDGI
jgi:hypothetical protein